MGLLLRPLCAAIRAAATLLTGAGAAVPAVDCASKCNSHKRTRGLPATASWTQCYQDSPARSQHNGTACSQEHTALRILCPLTEPRMRRPSVVRCPQDPVSPHGAAHAATIRSALSSGSCARLSKPRTRRLSGAHCSQDPVSLSWSRACGDHQEPVDLSGARMRTHLLLFARSSLSALSCSASRSTLRLSSTLPVLSSTVPSASSSPTASSSSSSASCSASVLGES